MPRPDVDVLVVGAGHGGLGVAARLKRAGREPLLLDAGGRIGDAWRERWRSLRLFTPRFMNVLPGMPFPDGPDAFPGKEEVADYLESYALDQRLAVRMGVRVTAVQPSRGGFQVAFPGASIFAWTVVVANGAHQLPRIPLFAARLDSQVLQLHSRDYGRAAAIPEGPVLVVGARNSGVEIAAELATSHEVTIAIGSPSTYAPARWRSPRWWRLAQLRNSVFHGWEPPGPWPWPIKPPAGRWIELDIARAQRDGVLRTATRAVDAQGDGVRLADGRTVRPRTVVWATGFRVDDSWINVEQSGAVIALQRHRRGPVAGLYILRASLLASLYWGGLAIAADVLRQARR